MTVTVRAFGPADAAAVAAMLRQSVEGLAGADYSALQVAAWAACMPDAGAVTARCADGRQSWVALGADGAMLGFTDLEGDGHIDLLYVAPAAKGRGVADALTDALFAHARAVGLTQLHVEASEAARRFYRKRGFIERGRRDLSLDGVPIHNYAMDLALA